MTIADAVKIYREKNFISQESLADALGVNRQALSRIERGLQHPTFEQAVVLAENLGFNLNDIEIDKGKYKKNVLEGQKRKLSSELREAKKKVALIERKLQRLEERGVGDD